MGRVTEKKRGYEFVRGPVPTAWLRRALKRGGRAATAAWAVWFAGGFFRDEPFRLTPRYWKAVGVPNAKSLKAGLEALFDAGLIELDCHRGRSPQVRIIKWVPGEPRPVKNPAKQPGGRRRCAPRINSTPPALEVAIATCDSGKQIQSKVGQVSCQDGYFVVDPPLNWRSGRPSVHPSVVTDSGRH